MPVSSSSVFRLHLLIPTVLDPNSKKYHNNTEIDYLPFQAENEKERIRARQIWVRTYSSAGEKKKRAKRTKQSFPPFFVEEEMRRGRVRSKLRHRGWQKRWGRLLEEEMRRGTEVLPVVRQRRRRTLGFRRLKRNSVEDDMRRGRRWPASKALWSA